MAFIDNLFSAKGIYSFQYNLSDILYLLIVTFKLSYDSGTVSVAQDRIIYRPITNNCSLFSDYLASTRQMQDYEWLMQSK